MCSTYLYLLFAVTLAPDSLQDPLGFAILGVVFLAISVNLFLFFFSVGQGLWQLIRRRKKRTKESVVAIIPNLKVENQ